MRTLMVLSLLALAGCATQQKILDAAAPQDEELAAMENALHRHAAEFEAALGAVQAPDCARLCELQRNICRLAEKICEIAARNPDRPDLAARCQNAQQSCDSARSRLITTCNCP
jgi:outer membrane murein-binding lipoprotein Lpp